MTKDPAPQLISKSALIKEIYSTTQLLSAGLCAAISMDWFAEEPAVAFTCLASGVERLLKLTLAVATRCSQGVVPTNKQLKKFGHDLCVLEHRVRADLTVRAERSNPAYVRLLLDRHAADPYWAELLRALAAWADQSGRYRDLRVLSGAVVPDESPTYIWQMTELRCVHDLGLMAQIAGPDSRDHLRAVRIRLAQSVVLWWTTTFRCWTHGLLGEAAIAAGAALNPATTAGFPTNLVRYAKHL